MIGWNIDGAHLADSPVSGEWWELIRCTGAITPAATLYEPDRVDQPHQLWLGFQEGVGMISLSSLSVWEVIAALQPWARVFTISRPLPGMVEKRDKNGTISYWARPELAWYSDILAPGTVNPCGTGPHDSREEALRAGAQELERLIAAHNHRAVTEGHWVIVPTL